MILERPFGVFFVILKVMKLRQWLILLALGGVAVLVIINAGQFHSFLDLLSDLRWYAVVVIVILQLLSYLANAYYYREFFEVFGHKLSLKRLYQASIAVNFVNYILPTAGFAGTGYLTQATQPEIPRGQATLAQLVRQAFSALGTLLFLPLGFLLLFLGNDVAHLAVRVMLLLILGIIAVALAIVLAIDREQFLRKLIGRVRRIAVRFWKKLTAERVNQLVDEFYTSYHTLREDWKQMLGPFWWSVVYIGIEMLTLYASFAAFGHWVNPGIVIAAYTLANVISLIGGAIISLGVFEAGMVGTLVTLGSSFTLAVSVTVVYRVLNLVIALPPGLYYYRKFLK